MKNKGLLGIFLALSLIVIQVMAAQAAPSGQSVTPSDTATVTVTVTATASPCDATSTSGTGTPTAGSTQVQPVAQALCNYFNQFLGISYSDIIGMQQSGAGFGEIAQACWMAKVLNDPSITCQSILQDKQSGDYSNLGLTGVTNWGQLKKAVLGHGGGTNLGSVVSGHAGGTSNGHGKPSWAGTGHGPNP